ncbi:MAG: serine hydrolase domain-containing protein [Rhizobiaceae bacterium]
MFAADKRISIQTLLTCLLLEMGTLAAFPAVASERTARLNDPALSALDEIEAEGLDVIVAQLNSSGSLRFWEFGELENDQLGPEETLVDLGSITKTVTAIAVLKLVEQGKIRLTDTLSIFWPETPPEKSQISIHQLLTHTSGLPEDIGEDEEPLGRAEFVSRVLAEDLVDTPGASFNYSNAGYGVLAAIIELRAMTSFENFLEAHLLRPNGLGPIGYGNAYRDELSMRTSDGDLISDRGHTIREASWGGHLPGWNLIGNGGLVSTPGAFLNFWRAVREERIVPGSFLESVLKPHIKEPERLQSSYGYGLFVRDIPLHGHTYGHDGGNDVFTAEWMELPQAEVIIFTAGLGEDAIDAMELIVEQEHLLDPP